MICIINSDLEFSDIRALIIRFLLGNANVATENAIAEMLQKCRIKDNLKGYDYLAESVQMTLSDSELKGGFTNIICPVIAEHFGTSAKAVERSIRYAIDIAYIDRENYYDKPSPTDLIWQITNEINRKYSALLDLRETYGNE